MLLWVRSMAMSIEGDAYLAELEHVRQTMGVGHRISDDEVLSQINPQTRRWYAALPPDTALAVMYTLRRTKEADLPYWGQPRHHSFPEAGPSGTSLPKGEAMSLKRQELSDSTGQYQIKSTTIDARPPRHPSRHQTSLICLNDLDIFSWNCNRHIEGVVLRTHQVVSRSGLLRCCCSDRCTAELPLDFYCPELFPLVEVGARVRVRDPYCRLNPSSIRSVRLDFAADCIFLKHAPVVLAEWKACGNAAFTREAFGEAVSYFQIACQYSAESKQSATFACNAAICSFRCGKYQLSLLYAATARNLDPTR